MLIGSAGNDTLTGGNGDDVLNGGGGVDVLDSGPGDNVIIPSGPAVALLSQYMASTGVPAGVGQVATPIADPVSNQAPLLAHPQA